MLLWRPLGRNPRAIHLGRPLTRITNRLSDRHQRCLGIVRARQGVRVA
jgi:hypothetical protein